ncbi:MAG TPA: DUF6051 family protein [Bacteroidales bacterium]|nr:DUF6051 family protein [Bacteroidales bacterium]
MDYAERYRQLKTVFPNDMNEVSIPGSGVRICKQDFVSEEPDDFFYISDDAGINENRVFSYPVFIPADRNSNKVILLLHGLNERSWIKYLAWAHYISEFTGSYVILFPISFHMNRSPEEWSNPRTMSLQLGERVAAGGNIQMASFANVALSKRLSDDPRRFFISGYRTACDITRLLDSVTRGEHTVIPATRNFNVFSYSIGSFLSEILFMANPQNLFSESKLFIFCGGSVFSRMQGTSKLIMDSLAFDRVFRFYLYDFEGAIGTGQIAGFFNINRLGLAFRSMIDIEKMKDYREKILRELRNRITAISLLKDRVIPPGGIIETLDCFNEGRIVSLADFPYDYSHENPFPVHSDPGIMKKVNDCFEWVMGKAVEALA